MGTNTHPGTQYSLDLAPNIHWIQRDCWDLMSTQEGTLAPDGHPEGHLLGTLTPSGHPKGTLEPDGYLTGNVVPNGCPVSTVAPDEQPTSNVGSNVCPMGT